MTEKTKSFLSWVNQSLMFKTERKTRITKVTVKYEVSKTIRRNPYQVCTSRNHLIGKEVQKGV